MALIAGLKQLKCTYNYVLKHNNMCKYSNVICKSSGYKYMAGVRRTDGFAGEGPRKPLFNQFVRWLPIDRAPGGAKVRHGTRI